jgi:hypothetical protein
LPFPRVRRPSGYLHRSGDLSLGQGQTGKALLVMNDATLKQIAAVKATVTMGSHIWT